MKTFGWTHEHCRKGMTSAEGWVWFYWALENEATLFGSSLERKGRGYVDQESKRLFDEAKAKR